VAGIRIVRWYVASYGGRGPRGGVSGGWTGNVESLSMAFKLEPHGSWICIPDVDFACSQDRMEQQGMYVASVLSLELLDERAMRLESTQGARSLSRQWAQPWYSVTIRFVLVVYVTCRCVQVRRDFVEILPIFRWWWSGLSRHTMDIP